MTSRSMQAALVTATFVLLPAVAPACAQAPYPSQTIKLIVPNPAGGLPDVISRIVGRRLQERFGQAVVVENRPGANAGIGTATLTGSPADGYTLLVTDGAILTINPLLYAKLPYDPKDVLPVAVIGRAPIFLAAQVKAPVASLKELVAFAKANPGKLNYGSIGSGSFHHLSMEAINAALGLNMTHVPFKGSGESVGALLGGHIDLLFSSYAALRGSVEAGKVRLLAMNGAQRSAQAPDVPSVAEFIPGFDLAVTQGVYARAGTSPAVLQRIQVEVSGIVREPEVVRQFAAAGIEPAGGGFDDFAAALGAEADRIGKVIRAAGLKAQ